MHFPFHFFSFHLWRKNSTNETRFSVVQWTNLTVLLQTLKPMDFLNTIIVARRDIKMGVDTGRKSHFFLVQKHYFLFRSLPSHLEGWDWVGEKTHSLCCWCCLLYRDIACFSSRGILLHIHTYSSSKVSSFLLV